MEPQARLGEVSIGEDWTGMERRGQERHGKAGKGCWLWEAKHEDRD